MSNLQVQMIPAPRGLRCSRSVLHCKTGRIEEPGNMFPNVYALRTVRDLDTDEEWTEVMECRGVWQRLGEERVGNIVYSIHIGIDINGWDKEIVSHVDHRDNGVTA